MRIEDNTPSLEWSAYQAMAWLNEHGVRWSHMPIETWSEECRRDFVQRVVRSATEPGGLEGWFATACEIKSRQDADTVQARREVAAWLAANGMKEFADYSITIELPMDEIDDIP